MQTILGANGPIGEELAKELYKNYTQNLKIVKRLKVPINAHRKRSLIWTPDASRATALIGNTPDAYGKTWHLPIDETRPTYAELIALASGIYGEKFHYTVVPKWLFQIGAWVSPKVKELLELLPRYAYDNLFSDARFREKFPDFKVTTYRQGIELIRSEQLEEKNRK